MGVQEAVEELEKIQQETAHLAECFNLMEDLTAPDVCLQALQKNKKRNLGDAAILALWAIGKKSQRQQQTLQGVLAAVSRVQVYFGLWEKIVFEYAVKDVADVTDNGEAEETLLSRDIFYPILLNQFRTIKKNHQDIFVGQKRLQYAEKELEERLKKGTSTVYRMYLHRRNDPESFDELYKAEEVFKEGHGISAKLLGALSAHYQVVSNLGSFTPETNYFIRQLHLYTSSQLPLAELVEKCCDKNEP